MIKREIFDQIDKIYFNDFAFEVENEANIKNTSEYELNRQLNFLIEIKNENEIVEQEENENLGDLKQTHKIEKQFSKLEIKNRTKKLQVEHEIVCRKVSDIILENSKSFSQELQRVSEFKFILEDSYQICSIARRSLFMSEHSFFLPSLKLVKKQIKKQNLIKLLNTILEIKKFVSCLTFLCFLKFKIVY
jgi:hypothetical protein